MMPDKVAHHPGTKPLPGERFTFEEFLDTEFDHARYEWVNDEAQEMAPSEDIHVRVTGYLFRILSDYVEAKDLGEVLPSPFLMRCLSGGSAREPDIMFVAKSNLHLIQRMFLDGPADVAIEVLSPSTRTVDRREKFGEYEAGGVREYWIIDPLRQSAEFFLLENGRFVLAQLDAQGRYKSRAIEGFWIDSGWLWARKPKSEVLKLLGL